jgi:hypothetical protein
LRTSRSKERCSEEVPFDSGSGNNIYLIDRQWSAQFSLRCCDGECGGGERSSSFCGAAFHGFEHFGFEEQDAAAFFDVGEPLVHPVVEGDKGDVEVGGDLFAGDEGFVVGERHGGRLPGECGQFFAENIADPTFDFGFGGDDDCFHSSFVVSGFLIGESVR